mmetsp:Transcript_21088/g.56800  ORF Transcript_21088/g.56800 Transcript_21088/m.56800 type:complete len:321 (+) Transcript_21088:69-1031(+)
MIAGVRRPGAWKWAWPLTRSLTTSTPTRQSGGTLVERTVLREIYRLASHIEACADGQTIRAAVRSGVCEHNSTSALAIKTEELIERHGGARKAVRAQAVKRPLTLEDGFSWIRTLSLHVAALDDFRDTGAFEPQRRGPDLSFLVGQVVAHRSYHRDSPRGMGVITAWEPSFPEEAHADEPHQVIGDGGPAASSCGSGFVDARLCFAAVDRGRGGDEPHYRVLTRGGEARLVAQSLLQPLTGADGERRMRDGGALFTHLAWQGQYAPNSWLAQRYPDDAHEVRAGELERAQARVYETAAAGKAQLEAVQLSQGSDHLSAPL